MSVPCPPGTRFQQTISIERKKNVKSKTCNRCNMVIKFNCMRKSQNIIIVLFEDLKLSIEITFSISLVFIIFFVYLHTYLIAYDIWVHYCQNGHTIISTLLMINIRYNKHSEVVWLFKLFEPSGKDCSL